ncbi:MAG: amidohydrolase [Clostridia bacterium]|nr:amidohydrolase [Clostridia bacterium]
MTVQEIKNAVCVSIDKNRDKIIAVGESIFRDPELGYKEFKTAEKVKNVFEELGLEYKDKIARTGIVASMKGREHKLTVSVMGELDAVVAPQHPFADKITGAAHSCGHFAQIAAMLGVAYGLKESGVMEHLSGDISFMAVPAEEGVELEWRNEMMQKGEISYLGGKQEFVKLGIFDDIDVLLMQHTATDDKMTTAGPNAMGFVAKIIQYIGKESHAASPHKGINALDAARIGLTACDALRTTFKDEDGIRFHPIITKGGNLVNVVPAFVQLETYVRGRSNEAIKEASSKIDRALKAGADALGAECKIYNIPGYMTPFESDLLKEIAEENMVSLVGKDGVEKSMYQCTTDANDISNLIPTLHASIGGATGTAHSKEYEITNPELAYINAAKMLAMTVVDLLADGAGKGIEVKNSFNAPHTKKSYLEYLESLKNQ